METPIYQYQTLYLPSLPQLQSLINSQQQDRYSYSSQQQQILNAQSQIHK